MKKVLSLFLVVLMMFTALPLYIFAAEEDPFSDVSSSDWYYDEVLYATENDLFTGTTATEFAPGASMTREMIVVVLARLVGVNVADYEGSATGFTDVDEDGYYAPYIAWAADHGITNGRGDGLFMPKGIVTRKELATFICRLLEAYGIEIHTELDTAPADRDDIADWALTSMELLWAAGVFEGDQYGKVNPEKATTRAEAAAIFSRVHENINREETLEPDTTPEDTEDEDLNIPGFLWMDRYYTVSFYDGNRLITEIDCRNGYAPSRLPSAAQTAKDGYVFLGWYMDKSFTKPYDTDDKFYSDIKVYAKYEPVEVPEPPVDDDIYTDNYDSSIEYADSLIGGVNASYSADRSYVTLSNNNAVITYPLTGSLELSSMASAAGGEYLASLPQVFVRGEAGKIYYLTDSGSAERMNIYRMGAYYYEIHMLNGSVAGEVQQSESISLNKFTNTNDLSGVTYENGGVSFTVADNYDPYIYSQKLAVDADLYNALEVTLSTTASTVCRIYLEAGSHNSFSEEQTVNFTTIPDGELHTYVIPLSSVTDYNGVMRRLRFDIGTTVGEKVTIASVKVLALDEDVPEVKLDRTFHLYSDKLHEVVRVVAEEAEDSVSTVGTVTKINANTVAVLLIKDKNGTHTSLEGVDNASVEYVGFSITGAGVWGMILPAGDGMGTISVAIEGGDYIITREYTVPGGRITLNRGDSISVGQRIYTDDAGDLEAFARAAEEERNPLTGITVTGDGAAYRGYDSLRGAYRVDVDGHDFNTAYNNPDRRFTAEITIPGGTAQRNIYIYTHTDSGHLEAGVVLSEDGVQLPIATEVMKNFRGENEEPFYDMGDTAYGEVLVPLTVEADEDTSVQVVNLYQNWGRAPLKQLSSVQFTSPYYHLSTGVTETNCIAPYYVYGKDMWVLPDFRAMSAPMWSTQPQHASVGRLYFLKYTDSKGVFVGSESVEHTVASSGPTYSDITTEYISDDGKITAEYRHVEMPQTDENRTYYTIELTVNEDVEIANFKEDFSFFSFDGRDVYFKQVGYLASDGSFAAQSAGESKYVTLGKDAPYISCYDGTETADLTAYTNFGLIVKSSSITIGGVEYEGSFILRDNSSATQNNIALTLDLGAVTLKRGDKLVINMILLPWGDPSATDDANVRYVREDSALDPFCASAQLGTVTADTYIPTVEAVDGEAQFTLTGGANNCTVKVSGFSDYRGITVYEMMNGEWTECDFSSAHGYDGYAVHCEEDGYSYSFVVNMDEGARTFRVVGE